MDVEIWCDGWHDIDRKFPSAFSQYIYGRTSRGSYGLPYQLDLLRDHGLAATFFVEPLFSARFGRQPLAEIVGLIRDASQDVQLHLHTEWVDEASQPLLPNVTGKRQHLMYFSLDEQTELVAAGVRMLKDAGAESPTAFRAGSFAFNRDTLRALAANEIRIDSSYNATQFGPQSGTSQDIAVSEPFECEGVFEYPLTVFKDGLGALRPVQLTACSFAEIESLLWDALSAERSAFVMLTHNFELLSPSKNQPDDVAIERFKRFCKLLDRNRDSFRMCSFGGFRPNAADHQPGPLRTTRWNTCTRVLEQIYRRKYR
jgi:hypothetical protein